MGVGTVAGRQVKGDLQGLHRTGQYLDCGRYRNLLGWKTYRHTRRYGCGYSGCGTNLRLYNVFF